MKKEIKNSQKIFSPLFILLFFLLPFSSLAAPCAGNCRVFDCSYYSEIYHSGDCSYYQNCCIKASELDTSGADPDPTGAGLEAGGTLQNPNAGTGGATGGTVTPGTSGISATPTSRSAATSTAAIRTGSTGGIVPCTDDCTLCHLVLGFKNIYDFLFEILLVVTTLIIVIAGIMYMTSAGSKGMVEKAKSAFTYAIVALVLALTAWLIINTTLHALGYKNVGNWWTFTCDTTQTIGPGTVGPGGTTLPAPGNVQANTAKGDGTCGGTKGIVEDPGNCTRTSQALDTVLSCIKGKMAFDNEGNGNGVLAGINPFRTDTVFAAGKLSINTGIDYGGHVTNSCHYGGRNCQGQANAADLHGDLPAIRDAAISCGANSVIYNGTAYYGGNSKSASDHTKHVHISVNNAACGCDYLK